MWHKPRVCKLGVEETWMFNVFYWSSWEDQNVIQIHHDHLIHVFQENVILEVLKDDHEIAKPK